MPVKPVAGSAQPAKAQAKTQKAQLVTSSVVLGSDLDACTVCMSCIARTVEELAARQGAASQLQAAVVYGDRLNGDPHGDYMVARLASVTVILCILITEHHKSNIGLTQAMAHLHATHLVPRSVCPRLSGQLWTRVENAVRQNRLGAHQPAC